jgi:hypothetical protein
LICRVTPVALVTTKQRKAGLIPAKLPHETVALTVGREFAARFLRRIRAWVATPLLVAAVLQSSPRAVIEQASG